MYGALWAYSTVFAASFTANVPVFFLNNGETCNVEQDGRECLGPFFVWLSVFALVSIPLSCMELREQVPVQVLMFVARLLVVLLMTGTVLGGYGCDGTVFADMGTDHRECMGWRGKRERRTCPVHSRLLCVLYPLTPLTRAAGPDTPLFEFSGLATVMPVSIYAFIFHHSVPVLSEPVKDKKSLPVVFRAAFLIVGGAYVSLGLILAVWFGKEHVYGQCNLNWRQYVGCVAPHGDGSPVTLADRTPGAAIVSFIILIFPALDVLSAYPLNAITLGNNLLSAVHSTTSITGVGSVEPPEPVTTTWADWFSAMVNPWSARAKRRVMFRLIAAVPPVVAGALSTLFGINLTQILSFTGLIGVAIAFGIPSVLRAWSFTRHRAILQSVASGVGEIAASKSGGKVIPESETSSEVNSVIDSALSEQVPLRDVLKATQDDKEFARTPYTNIVMRFLRCDQFLFVFAVGIAIFVLVGLIVNNGQ
jgi:hypothetical protein